MERDFSYRHRTERVSADVQRGYAGDRRALWPNLSHPVVRRPRVSDGTSVFGANKPPLLVMKRAVPVLAALAVLAGCGGAATAAPTSPPPTPSESFDARDYVEKLAGSCPVIVAHRGASVLQPENTLAAVKAADRVGADMVELDVARTRDGHLIIMHDTTLARTTNAERVFPRRAPWRVKDFTLRQVKRLNAGSGEKVPTLYEAYRLLDRRGLGFMLEIKTPGLYPGIARDVAAAVNRHGAVRTEVVSFDRPVLNRVNNRDRRITTGWIVKAPPKKVPGWVDFVNPNYTSVGKKWVKATHRRGDSTRPWTVDTRRDLAKVTGWGVDGVTTNRPGRMADQCGS